MLVITVKESVSTLKLQIFCNFLESWCIILTRWLEIWNRFDVITLGEDWDDDENDYRELDKLTRRINQITSMTLIRDWDDKRKEKFLNCSTMGMQSKLNI